jgi:L-ascorbate metabolism protein UlaG (beta-lactamase superfamily)
MLFRFLLILFLTPAAALAERIPSHCIALADATPGLTYLHKAAFTDPLPADTVRLSYIAQASFLIQTPGGLSAVTDFTGFIGNTRLIPDVVTMNHAHETHFTHAPDPAIPHVLQGWEDFGGGITHHLDLGEMLVRNVSTDIRSRSGGVEEKGNSIFIFETAGLCIGHLGHLHHEPTPDQYAAIGRLDVVMAPVDGGMTLPLPDMIRVLKRLRASGVIPMHWFSDFGLGNFLSAMDGAFAVVETEESELVLSLATLPKRPTIITLRPRFLRDPG